MKENKTVKRLVALGVSTATAIGGVFLIVPWEGANTNRDGLHVASVDVVGVNTACWGQTGKPLSEAPATNGPSIPEGIISTFDIESSRTQQAPTIYGFIAEDYGGEIPSFVQEIEEESFFLAFKNELKERARNKRKSVEQAGIEVNDQFIATSVEDQNRVANMVTTLINDLEMEVIDFEYSPNSWITIPREFGLNVGKAVGRHVQSCFSWCRNIHQQIDNMEIDINSLENAFPILQEIGSFGAQEDFYPEENSGEV